jgi:hypothetical protein
LLRFEILLIGLYARVAGEAEILLKSGYLADGSLFSFVNITNLFCKLFPYSSYSYIGIKAGAFKS